MKRILTLCLPYYRNAGMLAEQLRRLEQLPEAIKSAIAVIVVDDGSPDGDAIGRQIGCPLSIFKIGVDVRWNQDAARNIAVHEAETPWVLLTDIDHIVPKGAFERILFQKLQKAYVYRFNRVTLEANDKGNLIETPYKPHPNTWLMTKGLYDRIGGYDERFAGLYGTDAEFRDRLVKHADTVMLFEAIIRVPRETIADASTIHYLRKQPEDSIGIPRIKAERAKDPNWTPLRLSFPYRQIYP